MTVCFLPKAKNPHFRSSLALLLISLVGCGNDENPKVAASPQDNFFLAPGASTNSFRNSEVAEGRFVAPSNPAPEAAIPVSASPAGGAGAGQSGPAAAVGGGIGAQNIPARKIIQNHNLDVAVEDLEVAEKRLMDLVVTSGGYISRSELGSNPGAKRQGSWTLRVPGNKASDIAAKIVALGEPIRQSSDARDVSEEYYDLEARIKNKKIEEERLIQHLKDSTGKLIDILAVEKELTRVRGEIEQAQGRLNMLANLTSLATIQVSLVEHKNYKPEPAPTFWTKAARTFHQSLEGLFESFAKFTLWVISWAPWLVFWGILIGFGRVIWIVRKAIKKD